MTACGCFVDDDDDDIFETCIQKALTRVSYVLVRTCYSTCIQPGRYYMSANHAASHVCMYGKIWTRSSQSQHVGSPPRDRGNFVVNYLVKDNQV